jgi:hypothetical protein
MQEHVSQEIGRLDYLITAASGDDEEEQDGKIMIKCQASPSNEATSQ